VQTQTLPNSISVYPNPATSILNIELKINKWDNEFKIVELYNSIGQLIISSPLERGLSGELKARLNSSSLQKGLYYINGNYT
jgi:hypothetical protein